MFSRNSLFHGKQLVQPYSRALDLFIWPHMSQRGGHPFKVLLEETLRTFMGRASDTEMQLFPKYVNGNTKKK